MADMDSDGVVDAAAGELRMQIYAGVQAAQSVIRMRAVQADAERRRDLEQARDLQQQLTAEQSVARAELAPVSSASWWDQAEPSDVARVYERAVAWRDVDPEARAADERIRAELRDRYNIDVQETSADPVAVRSAIEYAEQFRDRADEERRGAERDRQDALALTVEADALELGAESIERAEAQRLQADADLLAADAGLAWDSSERRDAHAAVLERAGKTVEADVWRQADLDQGKHPREAIAAGKKRAPKARAAAAATPARQAERSGR